MPSVVDALIAKHEAENPDATTGEAILMAMRQDAELIALARELEGHADAMRNDLRGYELAIRYAPGLRAYEAFRKERGG